MVVIVVAASLVVGFVGGLLTLNLKNRWCRECGKSLACFACEAVSSGSRRPVHKS